MFSLYFLMKGGLIVTALRQLFLMFWNRQIREIIERESIQRGYTLRDIKKPDRKQKKISPFVIDSEHVNKSNDWIYYRIVEVFDPTNNRDIRFWLKVILDKEGKYSTDWRQVYSIQR